MHPVSRRAAPYDDVGDGLQAKFSIAYTVAFSLLYGPPRVRDFATVDEAARTLAGQVTVVTDAGLLESEACITTPGGFEERVEAAVGSPLRPMSPEQLGVKVRDLAGSALDALFEDLDAPAKVLVAAARPP